ncbi:MAG: hypothetical protein V3S37_03120 [Dehalococcoidia bacterium]
MSSLMSTQGLPILQWLGSQQTAGKLREMIPSAPVTGNVAPRGTFDGNAGPAGPPGPMTPGFYGMPGFPSTGDMRPFDLPPDAAGMLGAEQWPLQPGPDFVTQMAINDMVRQYEADQERRGLEEEALSTFQSVHGEALSNFAQRSRGIMAGALANLNPQLSQALSAMRGAGAKSSAGLRNTITSLNQAVKEINSQYEESLANLHATKAEFMGAAEERTAGLLLDTVIGMDARGRAEYEDAVAGMRASGAPESMVQAVGYQIRTQTAQAIGDQVAETRSRRMNDIESHVVNLDTNIANFETTFTNAFTGARAALAGEASAAFGGWAGTQADLAKAEAMVRRDYSQMRGQISSDFVTLESMIRQATFQGATYEAEMLRGMTIPIFYAAPLADAQLAYFTGEAQQEFTNQQAVFGMESGTEYFAYTGLENAINSFMAYDLSDQQIRSNERNAERGQMWGLGSALVGGGAEVGAAWLG